MGWTDTFQQSYLHHGGIMVGGFLSTLIAIEKIIPLKKKWLLVIPALSSSTVILFYLGHVDIAIPMLIASSAGLAVVYGIYLRQSVDVPMVLMLISALCLLTGNIVLLSKNLYPLAFPWWMGFLLFTIVSERLDLTKFLPVNKNQKRLLLYCLGFFVLGILTPFHGSGSYISGAALVMTGTWLLRFDVIRINLRKTGLTKFTGVALLSGYCFLMFSGVLMISLPSSVAFGYDAVVHTFFLGFVFTMIFAHGPVILPGVLGLMVKPYHVFLYIPLILLIASVLIRVMADLNLIPLSMQLVSGYLTAIAILLYFITLILSTRHALKTSSLKLRS